VAIRLLEAMIVQLRSVACAVLVALLLELPAVSTPLAPVATGIAHAAALPTPSFIELHAFTSTDGTSPNPVLIQASDGNFYGTTHNGGDDGNGCLHGCAGTVFRLTPAGQYTVLHTFVHDNPQGVYVMGETPTSGVVEGPDGFLYGTTSMGGFSGQGIVYKISKSGQFIKIHDFCTVPGVYRRQQRRLCHGLAHGRHGWHAVRRHPGCGESSGPGDLAHGIGRQ
jgi:uncharacterized repeat protein (TIGR03803 family)